MSEVLQMLARAIRPKRRMTIADWMEGEFWLSAESSAAPGPFRFAEAPYQRGIAEAISDPDVHEVVLMTSSQVGKTTILRGIMGYYMSHSAAPILAVVPSDKVALGFAADFVEPMIRDTPVLKKLFRRGRSKDGRTQTNLKKTFPGGTLSIVGANVPANLAMRPIKIVVGDEVDRWPRSAGKEGSPVKLATARTITFASTAKMIWVSTPVLKETSVISSMFDKSDKRYFHVKCDECDHEQHLKWDQVIYRKGAEHDAMYACESCGCLWTEMHKRQLVRQGRWIVTNKDGTYPGFHISALYSPWSSLEKMARKWELAHGKPDAEQTFYNTELGLPWSGDMSATANAGTLIDRAEEIERGKLDVNVALLTAGVDIQRDRIEIMVWGWAHDSEGWVVDHHVIYGDPAGPKIWADVEQWLMRSYEHPLGFRLGIEAAAFDSGDGMHTEAVYDFCGKNQMIGREWLAIKGTQYGPLWVRSKQKFSNRPHFRLYLIGTSDAKSNLYARYSTEEPGPSYVHIPKWFAEKDEGKVVDQMVSEWCRVEYDDHGFSRLVWEKKPGVRNEALDMSCYAFAIMRHMDLDLATRMRLWTQKESKNLSATDVGALFASL